MKNKRAGAKRRTTMKPKMTRREMLVAGSAVIGSGVATRLARGQAAGEVKTPEGAFVYCLNTSTVRGQKLPLVAELEIAAKVGYSAVEPWINEIADYQKKGGMLADLKKRIADLGLTIEDAIGFAEWIVNDDAKRAKGLEQAKRDMEMVAQIGGKRIAAPAAGAVNVSDIPLAAIAERYGALLEIGEQVGVAPMIEVWGFSKTLTKLSDAVYAAVESRHAKACVLTDVYHMYKGGSDADSLRLLSAQCIQMIHINDYPANPDRSKIKDEHRVFPGEGVAPLPKILRDIRGMGGKCVLSLELFNPQYWKLDATVCARTGLEKVKAAVQQSMQIA
ncbi:MAG TPA: sugar phosphate isomerase/epimerase family protein [Tepidisphaeraceae bacterium]|jgi:sugar phosphate isomerase/epimerase|nr:sugar phosphate isomerase/epimerase family protein [Tepidisphaeraceae bacterium]